MTDMKYMNFFYVFVFMLFVTSCYDDRGNYDYKEINEFEITGFNGSKVEFYTCTIEEEVHLTPDITFKRYEETDLAYEWYSDDSLISTARELVYPAKELKSVKDKQTRSYVKLKVTSNASGNIQLKGINVDVTPVYFRGFVVLTQQDNGEHELNFLLNKWDGDELAEVKTERNIYALQNPGESLGKDVVRLRPHCCFDYNYSENVLVVRDKAPYTLDLSGGYLTNYVHTANFFLNNQLPVNYEPVDEFSFFEYSYIVNKDGAIFSRKKDSNREFQSGVYLNEPNTLHNPSSLPQDMKITKVFTSAPIYNSYAFLYDEKYQRILCASNDGRILYPFPLNAQESFPKGFPLLHDLKGEILYIGRTSAKQNSDYVFVYKDDSGVKVFKIFVTLQLNSGSTNAGLSDPRMYRTFEHSELNNNTIFVQPTRTGDVMFFTGGENNKTLYCYEFGTDKLTEYVLFDETVCAIACEEYYDEASRGSDNRTLAVGLASGEIKIIDIRPEAQHEDNKDKRILESIPLNNGKIKDIICKVGFPHYAQ